MGPFGGKEVSADLSSKATDLCNWVKAAPAGVEVELKCKLKAKSGGGEVDVKVDGTFTVKKK